MNAFQRKDFYDWTTHCESCEIWVHRLCGGPTHARRLVQVENVHRRLLIASRRRAHRLVHKPATRESEKNNPRTFDTSNGIRRSSEQGSPIIVRDIHQPKRPVGQIRRHVLHWFHPNVFIEKVFIESAHDHSAQASRQLLRASHSPSVKNSCTRPLGLQTASWCWITSCWMAIRSTGEVHRSKGSVYAQTNAFVHLQWTLGCSHCEVYDVNSTVYNRWSTMSDKRVMKWSKAGATPHIASNDDHWSPWRSTNDDLIFGVTFGPNPMGVVV